MRSIRLLFAVSLLAALLVPATGASADVHETIGTPHTQCTVDGSVDVNVDNNPSNNSYAFVDSSLECNVGPYAGTYDVGANGNTANYLHQKPGEDCEQAGSEKVGDEVHTGTLTASGPVDFDGDVHFVRLGTTVLADGPLDGSDGSSHIFQAELEFIPRQGNCTKDAPITSADLTGTAEIYPASATHVCNADSTKVEDEHCDV